MKQKIGKIKTHDVWLEKHEYDTVMILLQYGYDIELIKPSIIKGQHSADVLIDGMEWEIKSPTVAKRDSLEQIIRRASKQSENVIIDLRRLKDNDNVVIEIIKKIFKKHKRVRKIMIITKQKKIIRNMVDGWKIE